MIRRENTSTSVKNIAFKTIPDQWQRVTVEGLEPDTQYWFDITVYRIYSDGKVYTTGSTAEWHFGLITTTTLQSNIIKHLSFL